MKKIVVINGHPDSESFNTAIAQSYIQAAEKAGSEVRYIALGTLDFDPNLSFGYRKRKNLEPDLQQAWSTIQWSSHQVWIHPLWWLGMPAVMKGFIDRLFLPGLAFSRDKSGNSKGLLTGKTARIIHTAGDLSLQNYKETYHSSGLIQLQNGVLEYCGISCLESTFIGPLQEMNQEEREESLLGIAALAHFDQNGLQ